MNQSQLTESLDSLRNFPHETECIEFKEAKDEFSFDKLGKYFSALSTEANLKQKECGWLIFGVKNDRSICGSKFRQDPAQLHNLKQDIANHTTGKLTFDEIYVVNHPDGRVVMFKIPPAVQHLPTAWKGHWYGRNGESLGALSLQELETIRSGSPISTVVDEFKKKLVDYENWRYDGIDKAVYLLDPDYTIKISDAGPQYGTGNYWWGNLLYEKPVLHAYSLRCKGEEVCSVLVVHFYNECLKIPYPSIENVFDPKHRQCGDHDIDCYCDVFYFDRGSIEYSLFYHIRMRERNEHERLMPLSSPITSQIKPPIIRVPFLFLENSAELQSLLDKIEARMAEFVQLKYEAAQASEESDNEKRRMLAEKLFSEWVQTLWGNHGK